VSIITCKRPVPTVETTAAALLAAGADACAERYVVVDGQEPPAVPGWAVQLSSKPEPQGVRATMWRAFAHAVAAGVDRLIYCEDDIIPCKNAIRYIAALSVPDDVAFIDFHDITELPNATTPGLYRMPPHGIRHTGYVGNLCMLIPNRTLRYFMRKDPFAVMPAARNHADTAIGQLVSRSMWPRYVVHIPRLVRHVGVTSAAHTGAIRAAAVTVTINYPGDDFDALTLAGRLG
jgi:hypothetical protein